MPKTHRAPRLTNADHAILAVAEVSAHLIRYFKDSNNRKHSVEFVCLKIMQAHKLAKSLHKRYEAACSYPWADTPEYRTRTENLEGRIIGILSELGFTYCDEVLSGPVPSMQVQLQGDPRGWPLKVGIDGREYRLGG